MSKIKDAVIVLLIVIVSIVTVLAVVESMVNRDLRQKNASQTRILEQQQDSLNAAETKFRRLLETMEFIDDVDVTMYNAVPEQTDSTPYITASGARINPHKATEHRWIAISRDLQQRWGGPLNFGDIVYVSGTREHDGFYVVNDNMNARYTSRIDILKTRGDEQFAYLGKNVKLFRVKKAKENNDLYRTADIKNLNEFAQARDERRVAK